ncbi:MAG: PilZ domain-containing protein [Capsulimonadaceae bacterium]
MAQGVNIKGLNSSDVDLGEIFRRQEEIFRRQDEAMALLERLRLAEPPVRLNPERLGGGRRQFRRWPLPAGVTLELHDGERWHRVECTDVGVGGARLRELPTWGGGPYPSRLKANNSPAILVLANVVWRDSNGPAAGVSFDFLGNTEQELWASSLIDALLAQYSLA